MGPSLYLREEVHKQQRQEQLRQAAQSRLLAQAFRQHASGHTANSIQHIIGRLGTFLIVIGTRLERIEHRKVYS